MDQHRVELQRWAVAQLSAVFSLNEREARHWLEAWSEVAGDASVRAYYRLSQGEQSIIVMDSARDKSAAVEFLRVADCLQTGGVRVPIIYSADPVQGYVLLEDFGDHLLKNDLHPSAGDELFQKILPVLLQLAACEAEEELPGYSVKKLEEELDLFDVWFLQQHHNVVLGPERQSVWNQLKQVLIQSARAQPQIVVHRDFHSCNLHVLDNGDIGVIDFQDAVYGPVTYDLASWLWDRYISWPRESIEKWMEQAREAFAVQIQGVPDQQAWRRACDFMGLQRNLKIVGIFARLHYRDGRKGYLELIPQFTAYIRDVMKRYDELSFATSFIDECLG